jgi:hypothetical protein
MVVEEPPKDINISTLHCSMDRIHHLLFLVGNREWSAKVHIPCSIQNHSLFKISIQKSLFERRTERMASNTYFQVGLFLEIVCLGDALSRPRRRTVGANANTAVATVTTTSENSKLAVAHRAYGIIGESHHFRWGVGDG